MCESVVVRHYNKEKRGKLLKNMRFSWWMSDRCTKEYFIQSKIHKMNKGEPVHIEQCYGETIGKTRKRQGIITNYTKKENNFVQFDKKSQKEHDFANQ